MPGSVASGTHCTILAYTYKNTVHQLYRGFLTVVFSTVGEQETTKRKSTVGGNKSRVYTSL